MPIEINKLGETQIGIAKTITLPLLGETKYTLYKNMAQQPAPYTTESLRLAVGELLSTLSKAEEFLKIQSRVTRTAISLLRKRGGLSGKPEATSPDVMVKG